MLVVHNNQHPKTLLKPQLMAMICIAPIHLHKRPSCDKYIYKLAKLAGDLREGLFLGS
jgi:hypothetical protein